MKAHSAVKGSNFGDRRGPARQGHERIPSQYFISRSQIAELFYCVISLVLGVAFFYNAISLAPVQLGIMCTTEVTQNAPRAN